MESLMNIQIRYVLFAFVLLFCIPRLASAQSTDASLLNLRAIRAPSAPFRFRSDTLIVISMATAPDRFGDGRQSRWSVTVEIRGMPVGTMVRAGDSTQEVSAVASADGSLIVTAEVEAPRHCRIQDQQRTFATIELIADAGTRVVPVDHECLIGDVVAATDDASETLLGLAQASSRLLDEMATVLREYTTLEDMEAMLVEGLRARDAAYRTDPMLQPGTPSDAFTYVLRPEETLRYGGDCEDWSIVVAGLLARVGLEPSIQLLPSHAFAAVRTADGLIPLDLVQVNLPILTDALRFDGR
jgi:hypothetical protein